MIYWLKKGDSDKGKDDEGNNDSEDEASDEDMQIFVDTLNFGDITLDVKGSDATDLTLKKLRGKIDSVYEGNGDVERSIGCERIATFEGKLLEGGRTPSHYNNQTDSTLRIVFGLLGGGKKGEANEGEGGCGEQGGDDPGPHR